jgi:hypothetical protein
MAANVKAYSVLHKSKKPLFLNLYYGYDVDYYLTELDEEEEEEKWRRAKAVVNLSLTSERKL